MLNTSSDALLERYLKSISGYPILTRREEFDLFTQYQKTNDRELFKKLVGSNLRLVIHEVKRWAGSSKLPLLDLIQAGNVGLLRAIDKYKLNKNTRFATYAMFWIKAELTLYTKHNSSPVKVNINKFLLSDLPQGISLDTAGEGHLHERLAEDKPEHEVELDFMRSEGLKELRDRLFIILSSMKPMHQEIVIHRLMSDWEDRLTYEEIGKRYGFSRERVRQVELQVKDRLRRYLADFGDVPPELEEPQHAGDRN